MKQEMSPSMYAYKKAQAYRRRGLDADYLVQAADATKPKVASPEKYVKKS